MYSVDYIACSISSNSIVKINSRVKLHRVRATPYTNYAINISNFVLSVRSSLSLSLVSLLYSVVYEGCLLQMRTWPDARPLKGLHFTLRNGNTSISCVCSSSFVQDAESWNIRLLQEERPVLRTFKHENFTSTLIHISFDLFNYLHIFLILYHYTSLLI